MARREMLQESLRLLIVAASGALLGNIIGYPLAGLAAGAVIYALWQALQLDRLAHWLDSESPRDPPESSGAWARVFDRLHLRQRQQRREFERLQLATNYITEAATSLSDGVIMVDAQGIIVWCNAVTERLLGMRNPQDQGTAVVNLLRNPDFVRYFQGGDYESGLEMKSPSSPDLMLRVEITVFGSGNRLLFVRDITKISQLERMRVDFIANVSHELRTPLTVIAGYLESLASVGADVPAATLQRALSQMQTQSERMAALVSDITLLSRLESEPVSDECSVVNVEALVRTLVDDASCSMGKDRNFQLVFDGNQQLLGEERALQSAFGNLVVNACKYTQPGGEIRLRWYARNGDAVFEVADNGVGVDAEDIPHLTKRFYRVDKSRSTNSGGTGLGLAIVKHALLRHDAQLEITSQLGKGSTFRCVFPACRVAECAA